jgi:hypothetical protein
VVAHLYHPYASTLKVKEKTCERFALNALYPRPKTPGFYGVFDNKERWRDVVAYVDQSAQPGDLVVVNAGFLLQTNFNYYSKRQDLIKIEFPDTTQHVRKIQPAHLEALSALVNQHPRVWLVFSHSKSSKDAIRKTIDLTHKLVEHKQYHFVSYIRKRNHLGVELLFFERQGQDISQDMSGQDRQA